MAGIDGFGTLLQRGQGDIVPGPETFTTIANVTNIPLPGESRDTYDATAHDSPNRRREHVGGLIDGDEFTVAVNYDPVVHSALRDDLEDTAPRNWRVAWPAQAGGDRDDFQAWLTGISGESPHDGLITAEFTFKITGGVTYVPVA